MESKMVFLWLMWCWYCKYIVPLSFQIETSSYFSVCHLRWSQVMVVNSCEIAWESKGTLQLSPNLTPANSRPHQRFINHQWSLNNPLARPGYFLGLHRVKSPWASPVRLQIFRPQQALQGMESFVGKKGGACFSVEHRGIWQIWKQTFRIQQSNGGFGRFGRFPFQEALFQVPCLFLGMVSALECSQGWFFE